MTFRFELLPPAILDAEEAFLWYQAISPQLAERFQKQLEFSLDEIHSNPLSWHLLNEKARCKKVKRFPYLVIFAIKKDMISVVAIIHEKRDPKIWKQRIRRK